MNSVLPWSVTLAKELPSPEYFSISLPGNSLVRKFPEPFSPLDSLLSFWLYCTTPLFVCQYLLWEKSFLAPLIIIGRGTCSPPNVSLEQQHPHNSIEDGRADAENQHRPGDGKHLGRHTHHKALWLCQDRHTVFSEFFQLPPKWGALIVLACRYKFKPARSTHIYLNLS